jgi:hypothetical protein
VDSDAPANRRFSCLEVAPGVGTVRSQSAMYRGWPGIPRTTVCSAAISAGDASAESSGTDHGPIIENGCVTRYRHRDRGFSGCRQTSRHRPSRHRLMSARPSAAERLANADAFLSRGDLRELGLERRAVDAVFRACPIVAFPGYTAGDPRPRLPGARRGIHVRRAHERPLITWRADPSRPDSRPPGCHPVHDARTLGVEQHEGRRVTNLG